MTKMTHTSYRHHQERTMEARRATEPQGGEGAKPAGSIPHTKKFPTQITDATRVMRTEEASLLDGTSRMGTSQKAPTPLGKAYRRLWMVTSGVKLRWKSIRRYSEKAKPIGPRNTNTLNVS